MFVRSAFLTFLSFLLLTVQTKHNESMAEWELFSAVSQGIFYILPDTCDNISSGGRRINAQTFDFSLAKLNSPHD